MNEEVIIDSDKQRRSRASLVMMAAMTFGPLSLAYIIFFYFPQLIPSSTTNEGTLMQPPLSIEALGPAVSETIPKGKWTLLLPVDGQCSPVCEEELYLARQVNVGLNKDAERVQRVLVVAGSLSSNFAAMVEEEYPLMIVAFDEAGVASRTLAGALSGAGLLGHVFLADPNGNIILVYVGDQLGKPMKKDLNHLLKVSTIG